MLTDKIIEVFDKWGKDLVDDAKAIIDKSIAADGGGQTSKLSGSVDFKVFSDNDRVTFQLTMSDYWKFQDKGVDGTEVSHGSKFKFKRRLNKYGKQKPVGGMLDFIESRHIKIELSPRKKGLNKSLKTKGIRQQHKKLSIKQAKESAAYAIGVSVAKKGIKPLHFMDKIITPDRLNQLKEMLKPVIRNEFILEINS